MQQVLLVASDNASNQNKSLRIRQHILARWYLEMNFPVCILVAYDLA